MIENPISGIEKKSASIEYVPPEWKEAGDKIFEHLRGDGLKNVVFDLDNVLMQPNSLYHPNLMHTYLQPAMATFHQSNISIGTATARGKSARKDLEILGIYLNGSMIFEGGAIAIHNGEERSLTNPNLPNVITDLKEHFKKDYPYYQSSWDRITTAKAGTVCLGAEQWQGQQISHFYIAHGENDPQSFGEEAVERIFEPRVKYFAQENGVTYGMDVGVGSVIIPAQTGEPLVVVTVKGRFNGGKVTKNLIHELYPGWFPHADLFIADGPGDLAYSQFVQENGGMVVGIRETVDQKTPEVQQFLADADVTLQDTKHLAFVLRYAGYKLAQEAI